MAVIKTRRNLARSAVRVACGTGLVLMIPLVTMQFTSEVQWDLFDFAVIGALLAVTGTGCEWAIAKLENPRHRLAAVAALLLAFLLTWVELAVGLFGTPFAGS